MFNLGTTKIAHMTGGCAQTIRRVIHAPTPTTCKIPSPKPLFSDGDIGRIVRTDAAGESSATMLKHELNISASVRTIQHTLARMDWLEYTEMVNNLPLTAENMLLRKMPVLYGNLLSSLMRRNGTSMVLMVFSNIGARSAFQQFVLSEDKQAEVHS